MNKISSGMMVLTLGAACLLASCTTKPQAAVTEPPAQGPATSQPVQSSIVGGSAEDLRVNVGDTVHFEYDKSDITDEARSTLQRQAAWLQKYPQIRVVVQGNCDERGTREYNLALGARRANAVKEFLASLGVSSGRVDTISYGKEKPVCTESTEECWAQNRRGVTVIAGAPAS